MEIKHARLMDIVLPGNANDRIVVDQRHVNGAEQYVGEYMTSGSKTTYYSQAEQTKVEVLPNQESGVVASFSFTYNHEGVFTDAVLLVPSHIPEKIQSQIQEFQHGRRNERFSLLYKIAKEELWMAEILSRLIPGGESRSTPLEKKVWNDISKNISNETFILMKDLPWIHQNISAWISRRYTYTNEEAKTERAKTGEKVCTTNTLKHLDALLDKVIGTYAARCSAHYASIISIRSTDGREYDCVCMLPDGTHDKIVLGNRNTRTSSRDLAGEIITTNPYCAFHFSLGSVGLHLRLPTSIRNSDFVCAALANNDGRLQEFMKRWSFDMVDYQAQRISVLQKLSL